MSNYSATPPLNVIDTNYIHYFPGMSRESAQSALEGQRKGTFCLRDSSQSGALVCSVVQQNKLAHLLLVRRGLGWGLDPQAWPTHDMGRLSFPSLASLVDKLKELQLVYSGLIRPDALPQEPFEYTHNLDEGTVNNNLTHEYKGMLKVTLDKKMTAKDIEELAAWRESHAFSNEQHNKVLIALGVSPEQFDSLCASVVNRNEDLDPNICVVCLSNPRQTAFVPCGHVCSCPPCATRLKQCPLCREAISQRVKLFM